MWVQAREICVLRSRMIPSSDTRLCDLDIGTASHLASEACLTTIKQGGCYHLFQRAGKNQIKYCMLRHIAEEAPEGFSVARLRFMQWSWYSFQLLIQSQVSCLISLQFSFPSCEKGLVIPLKTEKWWWDEQTTLTIVLKCLNAHTSGNNKILHLPIYLCRYILFWKKRSIFFNCFPKESILPNRSEWLCTWFVTVDRE